MFLEQPFGDLALSPHRYGINIEKSSLSAKELSWSRGKKPKDSETLRIIISLRLPFMLKLHSSIC